MSFRSVRRASHVSGHDLDALKRDALRRRGTVERLEPRRLLAAGDLDPGFDSDGVAIGTTYVTEPGARAAAVQSDGKVVVALHSDDGAQFIVRRYTAAGALDTTFGGGDGNVTVPFAVTGPYRAEAIAVQPDGKIVAAGAAGGQFAVARLNASGTPDTTFSGDGVHAFSMGSNTFAVDVAVQPDGKILLAGDADGQLAAARLTTAGALDTTFSSDGKVTVSLQVGLREWANAVALQSDGKILLAGGAEEGGGNEKFAVVRLNAAGTLDTTFAGDGSVVMDFGASADEAFDVAVQADGKIVAVGLTQVGTLDNPFDFAVTRFNTNGTPDTSFDGDGRVVFVENGEQRAVGVTMQGTKIVFGGRDGDSNGDFGLRRLNANGSPDATFGDGGIASAQFFGNADVPLDLAAAPDGKLVLAGFASGVFSNFPTTALARFTADGDADPTFGANGKAGPSIAGNTVDPVKVFALPDGKVLGVSAAHWLHTGHGAYFLFRHNADGSLDTSFGNGGYAFTDFFGLIDAAMQPDGKIVAVGYRANVPTGWPIVVVRFNADGSPDTTFSGDGRDEFVHRQFSRANGVAITPDGKIIIAGTASGGSGSTFEELQQAMLVRYNADGTRDASFGTNGIREVEFGVGEELYETRVQPDGKIVSIFEREVGGNTYHRGVARFNANGTLDGFFGAGGLHNTYVAAPDGPFATRLELQTDGKIVLAGTQGDHPWVYRATTAGQPDATFANGPLTDPAWGTLEDVALQSDGKILVQGNGQSFDNSIIIGRLLMDGQPDPGFGAAGIETIPPQDNLRIRAIALADDGKIIGVGATPTNYGFIRLLNDAAPTPDNIFMDAAGVVHGVGAEGNDTLSVNFANGGASIVVTVNADSATFNSADVIGVHLHGHGGNDTFSTFSDDSTGVPVTHDGGAGHDVLDGSQGGQEDTFLGGDGDDRYQATTTNFPLPLFDGGAGRDLYVSPGTLVELDLNDHPGVEDASAEFGTIIGTDGPNTLSAGGGHLMGNGGNDVLTLHSDAGTIEGGDGDDLLIGDVTSMNGIVHLGGAGNDTLLGTEGADSLDGGAGNDLINAMGNEGIRETLIGGEGDDTLIGSPGADNIAGGAGVDEVDYSARTENLSITLGTTANDGSVVSNEGDNVSFDVERVRGGTGNDFISATGSANVLFGNDGNDTLRGFGGGDALFGGAGNDSLEGGTQADYVEAGAGDDTVGSAGDADTVKGQDGNDVLILDTGGPDGTFTFEGGTSALDVDRLNVQSGRYFITSDLGATTPNLAIDLVGASFIFQTSQRLHALNLHGSSYAQLEAHGDRYLFTKELFVNSVSLLDLADNDLIVDYGGASPYASIRASVVQGRAPSPSFGVYLGIHSSTSTGDTVLAVVDNAQYGRTSFNGIPIDATTVIGKYTYFGDANLDGQVTGDDYLNVDANLGLTGAQWFQGDFNFDDKTTGDDYLAVDANLGKGTINPASFDEEQAEMIAIHAQRYGGQSYIKAVEEILKGPKKTGPKQPRK